MSYCLKTLEISIIDDSSGELIEATEVATDITVLGFLNLFNSNYTYFILCSSKNFYILSCLLLLGLLDMNKFSLLRECFFY
jgi:hypothetical protein